jgi:metal-responsive CopG/Arc/MetJ family transcriptional regulator
MAAIKATFTLDEGTVARLRMTAERLAKPRSEVVREAIHEFSDRIGRLSERERLRLLRVVDEIAARGPARPLTDVEAELKEIRAARRRGGRRSAHEGRR